MMMPIYFCMNDFSAVELYQAPSSAGQDLSQQDAYYITPVLLGVLMMIQMRLNPQLVTRHSKKC